MNYKSITLIALLVPGFCYSQETSIGEKINRSIEEFVATASGYSPAAVEQLERILIKFREEERKYLERLNKMNNKLIQEFNEVTETLADSIAGIIVAGLAVILVTHVYHDHCMLNYLR